MYRENFQQNHVTTIQNNLSPQIGQANGEKIKAPEQNNQENQNIQTIQEKIWKMLDLSKHIFKRKVILMILTIILALSSFIFTIILATKGTCFLQSLLNIEIKTQSLICAIAILIVAGIFCTIIYRGNILMLHCYWIICLFFFIIFVIVASNAYSVTNQDCESPTSYIFQRLKLFNINSESLFCTQNCPCSNSITNKNNNSTYFSVIQECPGWTDTFYSSFFKTLQSSLSCSGWCKINPNRYYMFTQQNTTTLNVQQIPCFTAFKNSLQNSSLSIKVIGIFQCTLLILIILYTNYYIFMQKQDEERQKKRLKKQLKEAKQRLQGQLKTSKRLLQ